MSSQAWLNRICSNLQGGAEAVKLKIDGIVAWINPLSLQEKKKV
jgi:hypothetical protein